jgi:hypothetical protein
MEKERIERQEKYEKEKKEKEERHRNMVEDIRKQKEEFKNKNAVKRQPELIVKQLQPEGGEQPPATPRNVFDNEANTPNKKLFRNGQINVGMAMEPAFLIR